ncbi:SMP-30/gluconolactonase/LRE family protein [Crocosphaera sp.]|uniref:SMP-30/gluconolactonase/LRE family protein n=1 Tax=Crocosphaera sp. TaxID=2729996 RepID=UPI00262B86AC|nr:SMP-30/gluconolactonase/LRE family protein [Crocosphaera sp.]MDJ0581306.1 SMP-30/gluconolactonase/LRE family protein [Crocosphaera sp.]
MRSFFNNFTQIFRSDLEPKSPEFKQLFPKNVKIERVAQGFEFTEGPIWLKEESCLLFSDIPANKIYQLTTDGKVKIFREPSNKSNGLTRDLQGRLIACEHETRRVTRTETDGSITIIANQFEGKKLNSPNDVVVRSDGLIYFTDPPYGISLEQQEQPHQGVYCWSPNTNNITLVAKDFQRPNGLAFSKDESLLYIDDSECHHLRVFRVEENGLLSEHKTAYNLKINQPGCPDGMKVDQEDNIYCTGAGGIWVFNAQGDHLGWIKLPEIPANCAWGDADWQSLYITARTSVYKIRVNIPGISL